MQCRHGLSRLTNQRHRRPCIARLEDGEFKETVTTLALHASAGVAGFGLGALWMVIVWAVPVVAIIALVAALNKNKA